MRHAPISPSDLQRIYLLYMAYMQNCHAFNHEQNGVTSCKKMSKKKSIN